MSRKFTSRNPTQTVDHRRANSQPLCLWSWKTDSESDFLTWKKSRRKKNNGSIKGRVREERFIDVVFEFYWPCYFFKVEVLVNFGSALVRVRRFEILGLGFWFRFRLGWIRQVCTHPLPVSNPNLYDSGPPRPCNWNSTLSPLPSSKVRSPPNCSLSWDWNVTGNEYSYDHK